MSNFLDETDLELWWRVTKEVYGSENVTSKVIGSGIYQEEYEYASKVVAMADGEQISEFVFPLPPQTLEMKLLEKYEQAD
jgi:hypothetical protein